MKTSTLVFYCIVLFLMPAYGQYAEMVGKPYSQRIFQLRQLYDEAVAKRNDDAFADTLAGMRALAWGSKDRALDLEADVLQHYYAYRVGSDRRDTDGLERIIEIGTREGIADIRLRGMYYMGLDHWHFGRYEEAFQWYSRVEEALRALSTDDFPDKMDYLKTFGEAHYHFGDYRQAIRFFEQAVETTDPYFEHSWRQSMNTMGLAYQQLDELERSDSCFHAVLAYVGPDNEDWQGIAAGNLGYNEYKRANYDAARPLLEKDIRIAEGRGDYGLAAGSAIPLADIRITYGELQPAKRLLDSAQRYILRSEQTDRLRHLYPVMARWYVRAGNEQQALAYMDSARVAEKEYQEKFNALQLLRANQATLIGQRNAALQDLRMEGQREINKRNLILSGVVLLTVVMAALGIWQRQKSALRTKGQELKLVEAERDLQRAREQLEALARKASKTEETARMDKSQELIEELNRQVVLTDEGWARFSELFGRLHPGFQHRLREKHPELTPAEARCLAMEKLHYTNKEMGALQGISTNSVAVTKHRIRKKLGLASQAELLAFIDRI